MLAAEANKCPPYARIEIMRDHTNLDWRDFIPHIKLPTLVCVAKKSNIFDWHGSAWVGENIPGAKTVFFEDSGHMLFWDEAEKFNKTVLILFATTNLLKDKRQDQTSCLFYILSAITFRFRFFFSTQLYFWVILCQILFQCRQITTQLTL